MEHMLKKLYYKEKNSVPHIIYTSNSVYDLLF